MMNHNYVATFRSFRDEFKMFKQSPFITHTTNTQGMDQSWLSPGFDRSGTRDTETESYTAASTSLSSSSQHATPTSAPSSDSPSSTTKTATAADEEASLRDRSDRVKDSLEDEVQEAEVNYVKISPQRSRKGHKKSRQGCFNCKRRKIKVRNLPYTGHVIIC